MFNMFEYLVPPINVMFNMFDYLVPSINVMFNTFELCLNLQYPGVLEPQAPSPQVWTPNPDSWKKQAYWGYILI